MSRQQCAADVVGNKQHPIGNSETALAKWPQETIENNKSERKWIGTEAKGKTSTKNLAEERKTEDREETRKTTGNTLGAWRWMFGVARGTHGRHPTGLVSGWRSCATAGPAPAPTQTGGNRG